MNNFGNDKKSAVQAKFDAQKIAFGPVMFQAARVLHKLGILEELNKEHKTGRTIKEVATKKNLPVYGVKVLLEAGLSLELVYQRDDKFFLTKTGWFVLNDPLTKVNFDFIQDVNYLGFFNLDESIQNEKPEGLSVFGKWNTIYEALSSLPENVQESWFAFDHYYSDHAFPEVLPLLFKEKVNKILDVGGNTGKFSISCAKYNEGVALTILDLPGQLEMAKTNILKEKLDSRIELIPINLLDHTIRYPKGYDIVWMSQFLDCFSKQDVVDLLKKASDALTENGSVFILETLWDKQKHPASTYSLHAISLYFSCLANGCSQMYHYQDMMEMIDESGLIVENCWENIGVSHTLIQCKKK